MDKYNVVFAVDGHIPSFSAPTGRVEYERTEPYVFGSNEEETGDLRIVGGTVTYEVEARSKKEAYDKAWGMFRDEDFGELDLTDYRFEYVGLGGKVWYEEDILSEKTEMESFLDAFVDSLPEEIKEEMASNSGAYKAVLKAGSISLEMEQEVRMDETTRAFAKVGLDGLITIADNAEDMEEYKSCMQAAFHPLPGLSLPDSEGFWVKDSKDYIVYHAEYRADLDAEVPFTIAYAKLLAENFCSSHRETKEDEEIER